MIPTLRPIKIKHVPMPVAAKMTFQKQDYLAEKDNSALNKGLIASILLHALIIAIKFPGVKEAEIPKEKIAAIKMNVITPPESYKELKKKMLPVEKNKIDTQMESGVKKVTTTEQGPTGDPTAAKDQVAQKSKAGSAKNGPLASPDAAGAVGLGDSGKKGYEFKGKGLKALMGSSNKVSIPAGSGSTGSKALIGGTGIGNQGTNLSNEYRAPSSIGDGSGHKLGTDLVGNFDRSTSTHGLANKKGVDTAFVQAETVVMGSIDPELLRNILSEYLPQFRFCYQQELQENSEKIKGIIDLNFRIEGDGSVSKVDIKSARTAFSNKGINCMTNILKIIDFPKPKGGGLVDVRQPLNFFSESTKI